MVQRSFEGDKVSKGTSVSIGLTRTPSFKASVPIAPSALKTLAGDEKYVGSKNVGFFGVLHTRGRALDYHPHVHYVVPGGGVNRAGDRWLASRTDFFVPVKALSVIYRAKFREIMQREGLLDEIDPAVWRKEFVTDCRAVGDGRRSLQYLAPYVFRVAISDRRIVSCDNGQVTFLYKQSGSRRWRKMTLDALEFIRRFLQHVLPAGIQKVRHYGFLKPQSKTTAEAVRWLVSLHYDLLFVLLCHVHDAALAPPSVRCAACGGALVVVGVSQGEHYLARGPPQRRCRR